MNENIIVGSVQVAEGDRISLVDGDYDSEESGVIVNE